VRIRPARSDDLPALLELAGRLAEFGTPPWRTAREIVEAERFTLDRALRAGSPDAPVLVAEDESGPLLGFMHLETLVDYFTGRPHAHVAILTVAASAEGRGIARTLLNVADGWARERGHPFVTLNVFVQNARARGVYERLGYAAETLRYVKPLGPPPGGTAGTDGEGVS
jgi:ribosomal protein S18 acetylase RimI-like enzyme